MTYSEEQFDITNIDKHEYLVAHCIAADLMWGGGIAPIIIRGMYDAEMACRYKCSTNPDGYKGNLTAGDIMPVHTEIGDFVNLITKEHSWDKPTYKTFTRSIVALKDYMVSNGIGKLCIPKIGCGLDRLEWDVVKYIIKGIFNDTDIEIRVVFKD